MKAQELTVEVNAVLTVSDEMASRCLRLLEFWNNDNPDKAILRETVRTTDGNRYIYRILEGKDNGEG